MKLPTEVFGEVIVVHTPEELGSDTSVLFEKFITSLERSNVVLDLDGTETVESAGLEAILNAHEALRERQGNGVQHHEEEERGQSRCFLLEATHRIEVARARARFDGADEVEHAHHQHRVREGLVEGAAYAVHVLREETCAQDAHVAQ